MKKILMATLLLATLAGCTTRTEYGSCVGAFDDRNPDLVYHTSTKNIVLGLIFIETIFVPAVVAIDETVCPVGFRKPR